MLISEGNREEMHTMMGAEMGEVTDERMVEEMVRGWMRRWASSCMRRWARGCAVILFLKSRCCRRCCENQNENTYPGYILLKNFINKNKP
jgi:hypothetical protein